MRLVSFSITASQHTYLVSNSLLIVSLYDSCRSGSDVGRNPRGRSFMFGEDPMGNHEEHAEEHEGNHGGKQEKHSIDKGLITKGLDHRGTK